MSAVLSRMAHLPLDDLVIHSYSIHLCHARLESLDAALMLDDECTASDYREGDTEQTKPFCDVPMVVDPHSAADIASCNTIVVNVGNPLC